MINQYQLRKNSTLFLLAAFIVLSCGETPTHSDVRNIPVRDTEFLKGLTKMDSYELESFQINAKSTHIYTEDGKRRTDNDVLLLANSKDFSLNFYKDSTGQVIFLFEYVTPEIRRRWAIRDSLNRTPVDWIGKDAVPFYVRDINNKEYSTEQLKGKVVVLNFWFIGCGPCIAEMPELNRLVQDYKNKNVVFLGLATDKKERLNDFLSKKDFYYTIVPSTAQVAKDYRIQSFPSHFIISKDSKITYYKKGKMDEQSMAEFRLGIDEQLKN